MYLAVTPMSVRFVANLRALMHHEPSLTLAKLKSIRKIFSVVASEEEK